MDYDEAAASAQELLGWAGRAWRVTGESRRYRVGRFEHGQLVTLGHGDDYESALAMVKEAKNG